MMHWGYRCLLSGLAGAALVSPVLAAPAARDTAQPGPAVTQPSTGATTGTGAANSAPGSYKPPAPIQSGQPISVLVFPFGYAAPEGGAAAAPAAVAPGSAAASTGLSPSQQELTSLVTAEVKAGLLSTPFFQVATYSPNSSLIQRAQKDEIIRAEQLTGLVATDTGAVDTERARTITNRLGIQAVLLGTLDVKQDLKKNTAEITLETQLINSTTGQVIRSAAVSGAAAGAEGVPAQTVLDRAGQEAALKILPALGIELVHTAPAAAPAHSAKDKASKKSSRSDDKKKSKAELDADRQAKKVAEAQQKADEAARKRAEQDAQKQARANARSAKNKPATVTPAVLNTNAPAPIGQAAETTAQAPAAQPPAAAPAAAPAPNSVQGTANAAGQPIPYGYAIGDAKSALPPRRRNGLKVPAWLGVAGFLTGVSFLL